MSEDPFLSRWSRLKKASAKAAPGSTQDSPQAQARPVTPVAVPDPSPPVDAAADAEHSPGALPPVESLTPESDFSPFMHSKVEESVKRRALKTLFQDPRFNIQDGLDVYISDFSQPDPLPDGWLEKMAQVAHLGDQPARLEDERTAARTQEVAPSLANEAIDPHPNGEPATTPALPSSDTSAALDGLPPVHESQGKGDRLS